MEHFAKSPGLGVAGWILSAYKGTWFGDWLVDLTSRLNHWKLHEGWNRICSRDHWDASKGSSKFTNFGWSPWYDFLPYTVISRVVQWCATPCSVTLHVIVWSFIENFEDFFRSSFCQNIRPLTEINCDCERDRQKTLQRGVEPDSSVACSG